ncbi:MAG TPA: VWA domain-containing protein [Planctomycetota bacterium]|nr:VWA domain-containing protein [Planctomycetota bacterium]
MIRADDPRVTAYALGETDETDRLAVEAAMAADPEVREAVASVRATARTATEALAAGGAVALTDPQRAIVLAAFETSRADAHLRAVPSRARRWAPFATGLAAAAGLLGILLPSAMQPGGGGLEAPVSSSGADATAESYGRTAEGYLLVAGDGDNGPSLLGAGANGRNPVTAVDKLQVRVGDVQREVDEDEWSVGGDLSGFSVPRAPTSGSGATIVKRGDREFSSRFRQKFEAPKGDGSTFTGPGGSVAPGLREPRDPLPPTSSASTPVIVGRVQPLGPVTPALSGVPNPTSPTAESAGGESYEGAVESGFLRVTDARLSTFSVDVDTASYANVRRMLRDGHRPPPDAVRIEEMVNYFRYAYPAPTGSDAFAVYVESSTCPWDAKHRLVRVALKGREIARAARPPMNLVFLLDVSGSMNQPNKLPLVQASMRMLLEELEERDTVAIVVYAGSSGLVLPPTSCEKKADIQRAIDDLRAGGSTNGAAGIQLAYDTARSAFISGGVNRVVLATDGDFNVGVTSREGLLALIEEQAKSGVFLTCLGYGMGNLKDATLEMLADKGNGNYGYVDSTREARKVLVDDASGTLVTIAKDVKIQVEFNPATVAAYRLVGYDNRRLADRDFADDTKDAGEVGAGHAVTVFYEVIPAGGDVTSARTSEEEPLRYGPKTASATPTTPAMPADGVSRESLTVRVRWKEPTGTTSTKREFPFTDAGADYAKASADFRFAAAVAAFGLVVKQSPHRGTATLEAVAELATDGLASDPGGYRAEFAELVARARTLIPGR